MSFRQPVVWILLLCALGFADRAMAQAEADSTATATVVAVPTARRTDTVTTNQNGA